MKDLNDTIETVVKDAIAAQTQAAIITAFGGTEEMVGQLVNATLNARVNGARSGYRDETFLARSCRTAIEEGVKGAMAELLDELRPSIRAELKRRIQADRDSIVDALMSNVTEAAKTSGSYFLRVDFTPRADG